MKTAKSKAKRAALTKRQISQLGKTLAQAIHVVITQGEVEAFSVKRAIETLSAVASEHEKYGRLLSELREKFHRNFANSKKYFHEKAKNGNRAVKGIVKILESYNAEQIISLFRFLKELPSSTDCDIIFKRVVAEAKREWGSPNYIVANALHGTKQELVSRRTKAYKGIASAVKQAKAELGDRNRLLSLDGVVSVRDGNHYIAFVSGGNNGHSEWATYLDCLKAIVNALPHAWIVAVENDCLDDVHYALVGFRL